MSPFLYNDEPIIFGANDIEKFAIWCVKQKASDITIQNEDPIFCHIYGKKHAVTKRRLSKSEVSNIIKVIYKNESALSILNSGKDLDTQWRVRVDRNKFLRFRVNFKAIEVRGEIGYSITLRIINDRAPLLEDLKLPKEILQNIDPLKGIIIVTGSVGSGKTTLLASILDWRMRKSDSHLKIATYESPIEYVYDDIKKTTCTISQMEIGKHIETFALGIRNSLRSAVDVVLVGEMRDKETISEGIKASMTGALVYSTLHSNGVGDALSRMINEFNFEERAARTMDILSSIKMIISQMLIPSIDGKRIAIREYLVFDKIVVDRLLSCKIENITFEIRDLLKERKSSFHDDLKNKYDNKLISENIFTEYNRKI